MLQLLHRHKYNWKLEHHFWNPSKIDTSLNQMNLTRDNYPHRKLSLLDLTEHKILEEALKFKNFIYQKFSFSSISQNTYKGRENRWDNSNK